MTDPSSARAAGRPKDPGKRAAILEAAARLFLEQGFERTTVDAIAAAAGVSKLTVYSHFEDKQGLFKALVASKCDEFFMPKAFETLAPLGPEEALTRIGGGFMALMFHPDVIALNRLLMQSAPHDPEFNRTFYDSGPGPSLAALARLLKHFDAAGTLRVDRPALAADHFFSLLKGEPHMRAQLNVGPLPSARQMKDYVADCVAVFLRAYAP